jgi:hypothetical protein
MYDKAVSTKSNTPLSLRWLGRALHTVQDFYSHTNYVELWYAGGIDGASLPSIVGKHVKTTVKSVTYSSVPIYTDVLCGFGATCDSPGAGSTPGANWTKSTLSSSLRSGWYLSYTGDNQIANTYCCASFPGTALAQLGSSQVQCKKTECGYLCGALTGPKPSSVTQILQWKLSHACLNKDTSGTFASSSSTNPGYYDVAYSLAKIESARLIKDWAAGKKCRWSP